MKARRSRYAQRLARTKFAPSDPIYRGRVSYVLLAESHTYPSRTRDALAAKLVWAREEGYKTAKARRANGWVDRSLLSLERVRLVEDATRLALS